MTDLENIRKSALVVLIERARTEKARKQSVSRAVWHCFELIAEARRLRVAWGEIGEAMGFQEKLPELRKAYSTERRRRERTRKEGGESLPSVLSPHPLPLFPKSGRGGGEKIQGAREGEVPESPPKSKYRSHFELPEDMEL
jgi:hypothetical protein